jgi:hydroxymethylglutaryl-CoA synthase
MRGILGAAGYIPYRRLDRAEIGRFLGSAVGKGSRSVASHDEDTTTMGVEAARLALHSIPTAATPGALWFATATPVASVPVLSNARMYLLAFRVSSGTTAFQ